ncbi:hypothetical protein V9T20_11110 (plasmid) [Halobacterium salinarum]|uniref:hypothetical protein n=1 Tax=Halobacterium salinarum TaxID=2242 RepID=UPI0030CAF617
MSEDDLLNTNYRQFSIPEFLIENGLANPKSGGLAVVISIPYKTNKVFRMNGRGNNMRQWFGDDMPRRVLLRSIGVCSAVGIAGCLSQGEARSITVYNYRDEMVTVDMRVVDVGSGDVAIDTEFSIDPDGKKVFGDIFERDGEKKLL